MRPPLLSLFLFAIPFFAASGWAASADEWVRTVLEKLAPGAYTADLDFVNYRVDGTESPYSLRLSSLNEDAVFVLFSEPRRDAGRQILNKAGEIWSYLPDSRKVVRLSDRDSIGNGDFNNADVLKLTWVRDYSAKVAKDGAKQVVVDMDARTNTATYYRMRLWIDKATGQPLQQYFYDEAGHHLKTLQYQKPVSFDGLVRPAFLLMINVQTGQKTSLTYKSFAKAPGLTAARFLPENLGK